MSILVKDYTALMHSLSKFSYIWIKYWQENYHSMGKIIFLINDTGKTMCPYAKLKLKYYLMPYKKESKVGKVLNVRSASLKPRRK